MDYKLWMNSLLNNKKYLKNFTIKLNPEIMKTKNFRTLSSIGWIILAATIISLSGCATNKAAWGSLKKGMVMKYQQNPEKNLNYSSSTSFEQTMNVMDQEFTITSEGEQLLKMKPIIDKDNDLTYEVTVEAMSSDLNTPRGEMTAKTEELIGKSFNLTISPLGNMIDYSGAEALTYDLGSGETKSFSSEVQAFFPKLPDHPIKIGDSWESTDKIIENTASGKLLMEFTNMNTFEKIETFNGYECMKVNVVFVGTLKGEGEQDNMTLITSGDVEGSSTWYYAYMEGIFVGLATEGIGNTTTEIIGGPQEMSIPASRVYSMKTDLANK